MNVITAEEARKLSVDIVEEQLEVAYDKIRSAAERKQKNVQLHNWWADEGYRGSADYKRAVEHLRANGFTVDFYYSESQFVSMYTVVTW